MIATPASPASVALFALMKLKGVGRRGATRILGKPPEDASAQEIRSIYISNGVREGFSTADLQTLWSQAEAELEQSSSAGIHTVSILDESYPKRLRNIPDPPAVLFVKGDVDALRRPCALAVVGTREPTTYGEKVARRSAATASELSFTIVSGLAHGCDTLGHQGCLDADGIGIAVMAHGLDRVYPAENRSLAARLIEHRGCLVSEYPMGAKPFRTSFAERDRIQSGLSDGVLVIETDVKGGTMHTVRFAREQKRALACLAHPDHLQAGEKTRGNQLLISNRWAQPISDGQALTNFLTALKTACCDPSSEPEAPGSQMSLTF